MRDSPPQLRTGRRAAAPVVKRIDSAANAHFKALRKLAQSARERQKTGRTLLDGMHLLKAYVERFGAPVEIIVSESGSARREIADQLVRPGTKATLLADGLFRELASVEAPSGIICVVDLPPAPAAIGEAADSVVLDGLQDPGNLGSILRSAAAAGFAQIVLSADCVDAWSPKVLRAAMGAHFKLAIHEGIDLPEFLARYRGLSIVTALEATASLYELKLVSPLAWVFGNEGQGVRASVAAEARSSVRIPMPGEIESLNVAAAAAACLFETVRQRQAASFRP